MSLNDNTIIVNNVTVTSDISGLLYTVK